MPKGTRIGGLIAISWIAFIAAICWLIVTAEHSRVAATSLLHDAVFHHDFDKVAALIRAGHSIDEINEERVFGVRIRSYPYPYPYEYGVTPLYVAAFKGDPEMVDCLIRHGANANSPVSGPYTILGRAASMLGGSVDVHATGMSPTTPEETKLRVLASLLNAGANADERKYEGAETPLEMCRRMEVRDAERLFASYSRKRD